MSHIIPFNRIKLANVQEVGGKNASLGEMISNAQGLGIKVPNGFAVTATAYRDFLKQNQLSQKIFSPLDQLNPNDLGALQKTSAAIQEIILGAALPPEIIESIDKAYRELNGSKNVSVAVRSSATAEDLAEASFAGQQETYLNISGIENVLTAIKKVYASLFTQRAISYRANHGFKHQDVAISVGVQQMIRSDLGASGVIFTMDTESGFNDVIFITAAYGLGEGLVQGKTNPDEFYVHKPTCRLGKRSIVSKKLGRKEIKMVYGENHHGELQIINVPESERTQYSLTDDEILQLAAQALMIEDHYKKPMDIEWGKDGKTGELYILQARPETVKTRESHHVIEQYFLKVPQTHVIAKGRSVGQKIGNGKARLILNTQEIQQMQKGEVLVTDMTDPDWEPIMKVASAIVTNRGGRTCHAAIVARELGIPAVVGCGDATATIKNGVPITVSCAEGEEGYVYQGILDFDIKKTAIAHMPKIPFKICMNLANPEQAFAYQFIPNEGVGLARLEFIISNMIGVHPNACLQFATLTRDLQDQILNQSSAYASPVEFYIAKLAEGIATIAAAFYPKDIIVRFSDFKSNEYANLLGGKIFEPTEENPMLGYRGASRYLSGNFRECFALECEAVKRVRNEMGLKNTQLMFPFVRTLTEAEQLVDLLKGCGLERGKDELKLYMMCEIPSNALLAEKFLQYFDGYSIGSNDLTQLTLGLDRDSELIAGLFDERNEAVKVLLHQAISTCKRLGKYVGICGQGPSDHMDLAQWLVNEEITSISLSPDSIVKTWLSLAKQKEKA